MHTRIRTLIAVAVLVVVAAMSAGCLATRPSGNLRIGVLALPSTDDPVTAANPGLLNLAYENLIARGPDGAFYPGLAKDWTVSADGRAITINLKSGVRFTSGDRLTAADVKASLQRLIDQDPSALGPLTQVDASGESTVVLTMARPYPPIWGALAAPRAAIAKLNQSGQPVGTGPFTVTSRSDDTLTLTANPSYRWAPEYYRVRGPARIMTVTVKSYPDAATLSSAVNANELDVAGGAGLVPPSSNWAKAVAPGQSLLYMGFDVRQAPYDDARVRRAIALLLAGGRDAVVTAAANSGWAPTAAFLPGAAWGATELAPTGDPTSLLAEAGFSRGADGLYHNGPATLDLVISAPPRAEDQAVASAIASALKAAGVNATIVGIGSGNSQAFLARYTWGEPDILYYMLHTGAEANRSGYSDARADRLLESAAGALNLTDRLAVYQALQQRLAEDSPWVPLLTSREEWLIRGTTSNIRVGSGGRLFLTTAKVK